MRTISSNVQVVEAVRQSPHNSIASPETAVHLAKEEYVHIEPAASGSSCSSSVPGKSVEPCASHVSKRAAFVLPVF